MKVVRTLEQVVQKSCEISIFGDSCRALNWPYFLRIEMEVFGSNFLSKLFYYYLKWPDCADHYFILSCPKRCLRFFQAGTVGKVISD